MKAARPFLVLGLRVWVVTGFDTNWAVAHGASRTFDFDGALLHLAEE